MSDERITDELLKQWAATRADDAGRLARELLALREQAGEPVGSMKCPICGKDSPHEHSPSEIVQYRNAQKEQRIAVEDWESFREWSTTEQRVAVTGLWEAWIAAKHFYASPPAQPGAVSVPTNCVQDERGLRTVGPDGGLKGTMPNPTCADLVDPVFNAIWDTTKTWDVNVPEYYNGYCGMTGSHVMLILNTIRAAPRQPEAQPTADNYVAWCRYVTAQEKPPRIALCDSNDEGAFKVYRHAQPGEDEAKK